MRHCPHCGKPEFASSRSEACFEPNCFWKGVALLKEDEGEETTEVEFISALDDAAIRQSCFQMITQLYKDDKEVDFSQTLAEAMALYDWVMGKDELELEEAAEPTSVHSEEECEPKPH